MIIWYKNRRVLEDELDFPVCNYKDMYFGFIEKEVRNIIRANNSLDLFKDFERKRDFFESVKKTMTFYIEYKLIK